MDVEPLSSVMTYQVQSAMKTQNAESTNAASSKDGEVVAQGMPQVDNTTAAVSQAELSQGEGKEQGNSQNNSSQANQERIKKVVAQMNKQMMHNEEALFGIHDETNRVTIKIVDKDTKEVIKELPPEKTLDMIAKVWELAGILVDERR